MSQGLKLGGGRKGIYTSGPHSALSDRQHHLGPLTRCQFSGWSRRPQIYRMKNSGAQAQQPVLYQALQRTLLCDSDALKFETP